MSCQCNNHSDFYSRNSGCGCNSGYGQSGGYPYDRNDARRRNDCGICRFLRCIFCPCQR